MLGRLMTKVEAELAKHGRWDIRLYEDGTWWCYREYDKCAGRAKSLLKAVRNANAEAKERGR